MKKTSKSKTKTLYLRVEDKGYGLSEVSIFREEDDEPISSFNISNKRPINDMLSLTKTIVDQYDKLNMDGKKVEFGNF